MAKNQAGTQWEIESDLLYELLTYGDGHERGSRILGIQGNWSAGHESPVARALLTWLVHHAFSIQRLPWHPDECFFNLPQQGDALSAVRRAVTKLGNNMSLAREAMDELKRIHEFSVEQLRTHPDLVDGRLMLGRAWRDGSKFGVDTNYGTQLLLLASAAEKLGHSHIRAPHNVLSSWNGSGIYHLDYKASVLTAVPIEDVLLKSSFIATRSANAAQHAVESSEWLVITRAPDGVREIPFGDVHPNPTLGSSLPSVSLEKAKDIWAHGIKHIHGASSLHWEHPQSEVVGRDPSLAQRLVGAWRFFKATGPSRAAAQQA